MGRKPMHELACKQFTVDTCSCSLSRLQVLPWGELRVLLWVLCWQLMASRQPLSPMWGRRAAARSSELENLHRCLLCLLVCTCLVGAKLSSATEHIIDMQLTINCSVG